MAAPEPVDYYELLAIEQGSDGDGIRQAVLEQRRKWLRRQNAPSVERQRQAEDQLRAIAAAEQELLDPARREVYDRQLRESLTAKQRPTPPPVVTHQPPATPPPPPEPAIDWIGRASAELQRGDYRSARYSAGEATERNPRNAQAWTIRGSVSKAQNRFDDAVFEFGEASRLAPSAGIFLQLAVANEAAGYADQAGRAYHTATELDRTNSYYAIALGNFWVRQARFDLAVNVLEPVLQENPQHTATANALGYALLYRVDSYLTVLNDGSRVFTSSQQVARSQSDLHRALSLPIDSGDLIDRLSAKVAAADNAAQRQWSFPPGNGLGRTIGWFLLVMFALIIPGMTASNAGPFIGLIVLALVIWVFVRVYRKPGWAKNAARLRVYVNRWGI